jgi:hypothetical protein
MKKIIVAFSFILLVIFVSNAQKQDTLDIEMKKAEIELKRKEIEMKQQELIIKQQEYELLKESSLEAKEEKKEQKTQKVKKEKTEAEKEAENKARMNKNTIITFKPVALIIGGLDIGVEKRVANRVGVKLMAGYYYSENVGYYSRSYGGGYNSSNDYYSLSNKNVQQVKVEGLVKFYVSPKAVGLNGLYVAPSIQYKQMTREDDEYRSYQYLYTYSYWDNFTNSMQTRTETRYEQKQSVTSRTAQLVNVGLVMGYQVAFAPIAFDINFAAGFSLPVNSYNVKDFNIPVLQGYSKGARPRIGFNIGVPF